MVAIEENIAGYLFAHAVTSPQTIPFIVVDGEEDREVKISYLELALQVKMLASRLTERRMEGKRGLLIYQDVLEFIISFLACQYAGIIAVPVPYVRGNRSFERLAAIMDDVDAGAIFCKADSIIHLQKGLSGYEWAEKIEIIPTDGHSIQEPLPVKGPFYNKTSFIQYTSGSTGKPKGVVISNEGLIHNQKMLKDTFGCDQGSIIFSWLPFHHDMGLIGNILHAIYTGATCILLSPFHFMQRPQRWLEGISKYKATHSGGPNFAYDLCVDKIAPEELAKMDLSSWKVAYNGSEPVRPDTLDRFSDHCKSAGFRKDRFYPCYGLAEAALLVSGKKKSLLPLTIRIEKELTPDGKIKMTGGSDRLAQHLVGCGELPAGVEIRIVHIAGRHECTGLEEGEICIAGDSVTKGYWNSDNADVFYEKEGRRFLRTGDLGFFYRDELFVRGRHKEMLIIRGRNFYPYDIEQMVAAGNNAVATNGVAIFNIDDREEKWVVVAEIKRTQIKDLDAEAVIRSVDTMVQGVLSVSPYDILLTTALGIPRTTSGKLQRIRCRELYQARLLHSIRSKLELPERERKKERNVLLLDKVLRDENAHAIREYVIDLIESKNGSLQDSSISNRTELTDMGVDSLRAMELINVINRDLNINIDATKIFQDNTLSGLVIVIENMLWLKNGQPSGNEIII